MTASADLVIRGGTVVSSRGRRRADVLIEGERVLAIHPGHWPGTAREEVDASGLFVLPGALDTHVHLMDPGDIERETFLDGTAAAAAAGVTTIVEHTHRWPVTTVERLGEKRAYLRGRSHVDYGLAAHVWPDQLDGLGDLWQAGVTFFKVFTCTTHGVPGVDAPTLLDVFNTLSVLHAPALVHCEDEQMTAAAERLLRLAQRMDPGVLNEWRSREAELLAVSQVAAATWLTGARVRVAHASNPTVLRLIRRARRDGAALTAETCPQYLLLREDEVHEHGSLRKFTPPARLRGRDDERQMWKAFNEGDADQIASDHAPSTRAQKAGDIWTAPFGLPGLDSTFPLMLDAALRGVTSLERVVATYAENPARHYRLTGKGFVAVGMHADLVLIDPRASWTLSDESVRSKAGWSPYADRELCGRVITTFLRGRRIFHDANVSDDRSGEFLPGPGVTAAA